MPHLPHNLTFYAPHTPQYPKGVIKSLPVDFRNRGVKIPQGTQFYMSSTRYNLLCPTYPEGVGKSLPVVFRNRGVKIPQGTQFYLSTYSRTWLELAYLWL